MPLQLDPRIPLVWRSPHSLQLGVDRPRVVLEDLTEVEERMLAALVKGVSRPGLTVIATTAGGDDHAASRLLRAVRPALLPAPPAREDGPQEVAVLGRGPTVSRLHQSFAASGLRSRTFEPGADPASVAVAVIVAHFVIAPELHGFWLRRDVPHLPVVFGDTSVRIGPLVEPGRGPCLYCLERTRTDADSAWPAIASQLWGRRSLLDDGVLSAEVAAAAARTAAGWLVRRAGGGTTSVRIDASTGVRTTERWQRHPRCGCSALPGTATAAGPPAGSGPSPTTTGAVGPAPA